MSKTNSKSKKNTTNKTQVNTNQIIYITRRVESSIALLSSPEDEIVIEALTYLSTYADIHDNNLNYLHRCGLLQKLLNLLNRNVCILRLTLRFLGILLSIKEVIHQLDKEIYNAKVLEISDMYVSHVDLHVRKFCVFVLSKLTESCRITCLIFKIELFKPILDTIQTSTDIELLEWTLGLFLKLVSAPAALDVLPEIYDFDMSILLKNLESTEENMVTLTYKIIQKLTYYCLDPFQAMFRKAKLIEEMLEVVVSSAKQEYHELALDIIRNSMGSEETSYYFIKSLEFLKFCQWVKTCDQKYHLPSITILENLSNIDVIRQVLFDLSVEDSILSFLRSKDRDVLEETCKAMSNMIQHKYCCEHMLTPEVLRELFSILLRKYEENTGNEVALKTIIDFSRNNLNTLNVIHDIGSHKVLLSYFKKGISFVSEESFLGILEMLYKMSMNPQHRQDIISSSFFQKLLELFQTAPSTTASFICEIMTNFVNSTDFIHTFMSMEGPEIFVNALKNSKDTKLKQNILLFIFKGLSCDSLMNNFLHNNLVEVLKSFSQHLKSKMPMIQKVLTLFYNLHPALKMFDTDRLDITDKLGDKFYLIKGYWKDPFPFFEDLEDLPLSTNYTIYVVDYSSDVESKGEESMSDRSITPGNLYSQMTLRSIVSRSLTNFRQYSYYINYKKLSSDPFLPKYIFHISKYFHTASVAEKVQILARYIDILLCSSEDEYVGIEKVHNFRMHVELLKHHLGSNLIPVGFLRLGCYCERALLFKAIADKCYIPTSLIKGNNALYWNEVALFDPLGDDNSFTMYVVDLVNNVGNLLAVGSRAANQYCNLKT